MPLEVGEAYRVSIKNAEHFEREFKLKYTGPGLYLTKTDTLVVLPQAAGRDAFWNRLQGQPELYCHVFNCPFEETYLSVIAEAPVRHDTR